MRFLFVFLIAGVSYLISLSTDEKGPIVQPGAKAYVRVDVQNLGDTVTIHTSCSYLSLLTLQQLFTTEYQIRSDSSFLLVFDNGIPSEYDLSIDNDLRIPIFVIPGDTVAVKIDYQQNKAAPDITYEGLASEINQYLLDKPDHIRFSPEAANLFNNPFHLETPQKSLLLYKHKSDSIAAMQQAYVREKADAYNLPGWFVELEEIESLLFARYHQLLIVDYWKTFFDIQLKLPQEYYSSIEPIDIRNPSAVYSFYYYLYLPVMLTRTPDFMQNKKHFLDSCGVEVVDDLKGTKAYSIYYLMQARYVIDKADELLPEETLDPILTNLFFHMIKVLDRPERAKLFDSMEAKLKNSAIWPFFVQTYEEMSLHLSPGKEAPDFYLLSTHHRYLTLGDFKGNVLLLNFWFPGCKPCIYEIPHEKQLVEKYADKGFTVINICMLATAKQWETALNKYDLHGVNLLTQGNWERKLKEAYAVDGFPHYVLVDEEGKIVENGTHRPSDPRLAELIEATLNRK